MSVLHSLIGRRRFLASTLVGTIGVFLSVTAAMAQASGDTSRDGSHRMPRHSCGSTNDGMMASGEAGGLLDQLD